MKTRLLSTTLLVQALTLSALVPGQAFASSLLPMPAAEEAQPQPAELSAPSAAAPDAVELAALYYYARNGATDRVDRESRRLALKFPGFVAPADLYQPAPAFSVDETPLWQRYEQNDFAGIDAEISRLAADNPGWQPSEDFRLKLERRKLRVAIVEAHEAGDSAQVISLGQALKPETESEPDLLWMLLDAYRQQGQTAPMAPVYRGMLFRAPGAEFSDDVLMATLQKAVQDFPARDIKPVIAVLEKRPGLAERMQALSLDIARREIGDFASGLASAEAPTAETVQALRFAAERDQKAADQVLLGWYFLKVERPGMAEDWFRKALLNAPTAESLKGLVVTLTREDKKEEAFALVAERLDLVTPKSEDFIDVLSMPFQGAGAEKADAKVAEIYAQAIEASQSAEHAQLLGWYAYNGRQFDAAKIWFSKALDWQASADSVKGLALTLVQEKDRAGLETLKQDYATAYSDVFADLAKASGPKGDGGQTTKAPTGGQSPRYLQSFTSKRYGECLADLDRLAARAQLNADAQLIRGWCHLELSHLAEARNAFEAALDGGTAKADDAAYGLGLSLLRAGMTADVERLLASRPLSTARATELRAEVFWQRARTAFDRKDYEATLANLNARLQIATEPVGMTQMRAWAHFHLGNLKQSRAIFAELNQVVDDPANRRGLLAIRQRMGIDP